MKGNPPSLKKSKETLIVDAALQIFKQKGLHKARMSDISKKARISYGLVYHYFKNKEDLFEAILNRWWQGLFEVMAKIRAESREAPLELRGIIDYFMDTYQGNPDLVNIFVTEISRSTTNLTAKRLKNFQEFMFLTDGIMVEGQKAGVLRKDFKARYLTYIFLGALETFISAMVLVDQKIKGNRQKERIAESILEVFLNGASNRNKGKRT
jgi:TetR/AcrR family transcriptional regulator, fatty acid metabolism regulator protein